MLAVLAVAAALCATQARAATLAPQERLCDPSFQDCRADILTYINQETVGIDIGFWMMTDARYSNALVAAWQRGVRIRILMDPRCVQEHSACSTQNDQLAGAGIPMRNRATSGILHWKMILFASQGQLEFAGANFAPFEMAPAQPYVNYTDEVVYFTNQPSLLQSFMRKFDDLWTSTTEFTNYANVTGPLTRLYPTYAIDPELNFPPDDSYRTRALNAYAAEHQRIDVQMFRITDESHTNAMIAAVGRGVPVRLITDETEYRNPNRLWDAYNVDKMYSGGVSVRFDAHQGIDHEKAVALYGTGMSIIGSSNWTSPSSDTQREHNLFTTRAWILTWLQNQFNRKWNNSAGYTETKPFVPLPPDVPEYATPADGAAGIATTGAALKWNAGLWGQIYDIYFGTSPNPPLYMADQKLGPSQYATDYKSLALPALQPGTTYYWKIVSKTMAYVTNAGPVWSFTTAGSGGGGSGGSTLPAGWSTSDIGTTGVAGSASYSAGTFTVAGGGADIWGTADAFRYVYQPMTGDGSIIARVASVQNTAAWAKAGVMIRGSLGASAAQASMLVSAGKGLAFQRRTADGATSASTPGSLSTAPRWVKLTRTGNTIAAYESSNGTSWTLVGSDAFNMPSTAYVGIAVSSHVSGVLCTSTFDNVTAGTSGGTTTGLPSGWSDGDVGSTGAAGSAAYSNGVFNVSGAGADVWGTADAFHYVYRTLTGDGSIVARVASVQNTASWAKAGLMIRNSLTASSAHAFILVSSGKGVAFQRRTTDGGTSASTPGSLSAPPRWVRLTRSGSVLTAYESADGVSWTTVGSDTIALNSTVYVGLAVSSHVSGVLCTATFGDVTVQ